MFVFFIFICYNYVNTILGQVMKTMRVAICDDEQGERKKMKEYAKQYNPSLRVDTYSSALDLLLSTKQVSYDVVFMDIEMPPPNGFEVATSLREKKNPPLVIFVTKSSSYTIQGYGIAFRYLPKPIEYEVFSNTLSAAIKEREPSKISFMCEGTWHILSVNKIVYCEALDHNVTIYTQEAKYTSRTPLAELAAKLPTEDFVQPHKSYLINLNYVQCVNSNNVELSRSANTVWIPLSKGKRRTFIRQLGDYIGR